jgi:PAS domain S-box-containing protein
MAIGAPDGKWMKVNQRLCDITGYDSTALTNKHFQEITHPDDVEEGGRLLRELYLLKMPSHSREKRYRHQNGSYIWVNVSVSLVPGDQGTPLHISIVEDITRRRLAESALRQSERSLRSAHRIAHLQGETAFDGQGLPTTAPGTRQDSTDNTLVDKLRESRARLEGISSNIPGMVFQFHQAGTALAFTYVSEGSNEVCGLTADRVGDDPGAFLDLIHRDDRAAFHESKVRSRESLSVWNWEGRLEPPGEWIKWVNLRATPRRIGSAETIWDGVIFNISESKKNEAEIEQSREMLRALSAHQTVVKEEEGKRIAREIHDELGQRLTVLRMDVMMLQKGQGEPSAPLAEAAGRMRDTIDGVLRIVRNISTHLRPAALDIGLVIAVEWLLDDFHARLGIPCNLNNGLGESIVLDDERATGVFRILQESLTNIARHANARHIGVALEIVDKHLHLQVKDDGVGFESKSRDTQKTFGLRGMRERALALGGEISIFSSPGGGTTVFASIPLLSE